MRILYVFCLPSAMLKKILFVVILFIGLVIVCRLIAPHWYNFLAVNKPLVDADILLVEGWVSDSTLRNAAQLFNEGKYDRILVASILFSNEFNMHSTGALIYNIDEMKDLPSHSDTVFIEANSSLAGGAYAKMRVLADEDTLGEVTTSDQIRKFSFPLNHKLKPVQQIKIMFTNDYHDWDKHQDRNLIVQSLHLDHTFIPTRTPSVYYDLGKIDGSNLEKTSKSRAGSSAEYLIEQGVPPQSIQIIEAPRVKYNKTYTTAKAAGEWLESHETSKLKINLISENVHSRRSWMLFKKEMPKQIELGIIASSRFDDEAHKWWKNPGRKAYVLNQSIKFWYAIFSYYFI